jgi:hypothetical protein
MIKSMSTSSKTNPDTVPKITFLINIVALVAGQSIIHANKFIQIVLYAYSATVMASFVWLVWVCAHALATLPTTLSIGSCYRILTSSWCRQPRPGKWDNSEFVRVRVKDCVTLKIFDRFNRTSNNYETFLTNC